MGASKILKVLEKNSEPLSIIEISKLVNDCEISSLRKTMARLLKDCIANVKVKKLTPEEIMEKYGKRRPGRNYVYWV